MKQLILLVWIVYLSIPSFAQKHDFTWMTGYSGGRGHDSLGISFINFNPDTMPHISTTQDITASFDFPNTSISHAKTGKLQFFSNSISIYDASYERMLGAEQMNIWDDHDLVQGIISLPHPKGDGFFALFNGTREFFATEEISVSMTQTWYHEINMNRNNGLGEVVVSKKPLITDILDGGKITAVRHGNGRDWWIIIKQYCHECREEKYYKILLSPEGWKVYEEFPHSNISPAPTGAGQAFFTNDGTKYVILNAIEEGKPYYIDIYDFDRCTGTLYNKQQLDNIVINNITEDGGSSLAISPNSQFVYLILWAKIIQYDLWAEDIEASAMIIGEYDGFEDIFPTRFFSGQLAPDGKIYICTSNSTRYFHTIHAPNEKGLACDFRQHDLRVPTFNAFSIPNYPNYRLYDFPDSPCDTLGINFDGTVTSTEDFTEVENAISVYPNPAFDVVNVEVEQQKDLEIRLYSMLGELVTVQKDTVLDVHDLASGVYVVAVLSAGELIGTRKVVVQ